MSIEKELQDTVEYMLTNLHVELNFDKDNDLEVKLHYKDQVISSSFVELDTIFVKKGD